MKLKRKAIILAAVIVTAAVALIVICERAHSGYITDPYSPAYQEKITREVLELEQEYPQALTVQTLGQSEQGRDIYLIKLGKGEKKALFAGAIHGTEYITTNYLMRMTEVYAKAYTDGKKLGGRDVQSILDDMSIYIVPAVNPDGVNRALTDMPTWRANANGVNLNQNFPTNCWDAMDTGKSNPIEAGYRGPYAGSEAETRLMMDLCESYDFEFLLTLHAKGEVLFWWDANTGIVPGTQRLMESIIKSTGYAPMQRTTNIDSYGGGFENWFRYEYNRPGICVELTPANGSKLSHRDADFDKLVWDKTKYLGLDSAAGM